MSTGSPEAVLEALKAELVRAAARAYGIGLQRGNGGNLSARLPDPGGDPSGDRVIIKPSGFSMGECTPGNLVVTDLDGRPLRGCGKPSKEILTHLAIYRARPDVHGIFHGHCPWATAMAELVDELPLITYHARDKLGPVPVLAVDGHADREVARAVGGLLAGRPGLNAFVQRHHGLFALAATITLAEHHAELVEETAQIAWLTAQAAGGGAWPGRS